MSHSHQLFIRAQQLIPGGVNSPVRAFQLMDVEPVFISHGDKAFLFDVDGKSYVDYVNSWGALILGHADPTVTQMIQQTLIQGVSFGAPTELELLLAEEICRCMPSIEMIRMMNSGTEAVMTAIRLARGFTRRDKILKFNGCYHGHVDSLLVQAGSGLATFGLPGSSGVLPEITKNTLSVDFNNLEQVTQAFIHHGKDLAAVIVEPVAGNMGCVLPLMGFLEGLRELCTQYGSLLIFDEVMTGFRVALGGAQGYYKIQPDLTILGKVIGGGLPIGALGGRRDIMKNLAPLGSVYQAGTLAGNPLAMASGLATLQKISEPGFYDSLAANTKKLAFGLAQAAAIADIPLLISYLGGMFGISFTQQTQICNFEDAQCSNLERFKLFFRGMLMEGVYLAPSMFESLFLTAAHGKQEIKFTIGAAQKVMSKIAQGLSF